MNKKASKFQQILKAAESLREQQPEVKPTKIKGSGKRSDPDYVQISAYIRKETHRLAKRKLLEEDSEQDLSDVIEELLSNWVSE
jgi:hypothetical protein